MFTRRPSQLATGAAILAPAGKSCVRRGGKNGLPAYTETTINLGDGYAITRKTMLAIDPTNGMVAADGGGSGG